MHTHIYIYSNTHTYIIYMRCIEYLFTSLTFLSLYPEANMYIKAIKGMFTLLSTPHSIKRRSTDLESIDIVELERHY